MGTDYPQMHWLTSCNHIVDCLAKIANRSRPRPVIQAWNELTNHYKIQSSTSSTIFNHLISVFRLAEQTESTSGANLPGNQNNDQQSPVLEAVPTNEPTNSENEAPIFKSVKLPTVSDLHPMFTMGPLWGHILIEYLKKLRWPVNDSAKQLTRPINIGELMIDLWLSTGIKPPIVVSTAKQKDKEYVFQPNDALDNIPVSERFHQFTVALSNLSRISGHSVIPGLETDFKTALLTKGGSSAILGRGIPNGPQSLVNPTAVARWKIQQQSLFTNLRDVSKLPLNNANGPFPLCIDTSIIPEFSFYELCKARKRHRERLRAANTPVVTSFLPALFVD